MIGGTIVATAELIEEIANRVVEKLRETSASNAMLSVQEVASMYGVSADTVYANAVAWGGIKVGAGPKAHWRFDAVVVAERLAPRPDPRTKPPVARPSRRSASSVGVDLLPIRGD